MTNHRLLLVLVVVLVAVSCSCFAFAPVPHGALSSPRFITQQGVSFVSASALRMSEEPEAASEEEKPTEQPTGDFYDDEVEPAQATSGISDAMRERLMREASTGLDPDQKQTNVILYIMIGVALLVIVGGAGIFY